MNANACARSAALIVDRLIGGALWDGKACTWIVLRSEIANGKRAVVPTPAGVDLYQGATGIALFLAEFAAATGDKESMRCAVGALHHVEEAVKNQAAMSIGLHSGLAGVAYVIARISALSGNDTFIPTAQWTLDEIARRLHHDKALDIIGGSAGAVLALLALQAQCVSLVDHDLPVRMGNHLLSLATRRRHGWSWHGAGGYGAQHLCGYAHGGSGIAHCFLELFAQFGDDRWRYAAIRAMEYEGHHRLAGTGDWPDYRCLGLTEASATGGGLPELRKQLRSGAQRFGTRFGVALRAWCHGAPGILQTRLRAISLGIRIDDCRQEALAAASAISNGLDAGDVGNFSLCHGLCGNVEALITADRALGTMFAESAWEKIGQAALLLESTKRPWPGGTTGGGPDPSLMLGESGTGYFFLRKFSEDVPSVTLMSRWNRPASVPPDHRSDRWQELRAILPVSCTAASKLPELSGIHHDILEVVNENSAMDSLLDTLKCCFQTQDGDSPEGMFAEILQLELLRVQADEEYTDHLDAFYERLVSSRSTDDDWADVRFRLSSGATLVETAHAWNEWCSSGTDSRPPRHREYSVIFRDEATTKLHRLTPLVTAVLKCLEKPMRLGEVVAEAAAIIDASAVGSQAFAAAISEMLEDAVRLGIVVTER